MSGSPERHAYLYTYTQDPVHIWRVFEAFVVFEDASARREATLYYADETGAFRMVRERHLSNRNSAHAWVRASELPDLAADIERDYAARQCWHEALEDVRQFMERRRQALAAPPPPETE